jgi:hypothetical protein
LAYVCSDSETSAIFLSTDVFSSITDCGYAKQFVADGLATEFLFKVKTAKKCGKEPNEPVKKGRNDS